MISPKTVTGSNSAIRRTVTLDIPPNPSLSPLAPVPRVDTAPSRVGPESLGKLLLLSRIVRRVHVDPIERTRAVNVEERLAPGPLEVPHYLGEPHIRPHRQVRATAFHTLLSQPHHQPPPPHPHAGP